MAEGHAYLQAPAARSDCVDPDVGSIWALPQGGLVKGDANHASPTPVSNHRAMDQLFYNQLKYCGIYVI
jgi:hypothetical protein